MYFKHQTSLGAIDWANILAPLESRAYTGVALTALTEVENRYGPYVIGSVLGIFAFVLYLGRKVLSRKGEP